MARSWWVIEERCTLVVIGGREHCPLVDGFAAIFRDPGTQRHVGARDGRPAVADWSQWLWTSMLSPSSGRWRAVAAASTGR